MSKINSVKSVEKTEKSIDNDGLAQSVNLAEITKVKIKHINDQVLLEPKFINKVNNIIEENYQNPDFRVSRLAKIIGISERQLSRKIKKLTNQTTAEYIRLYRLKKAKNLLGDTLTVGEISHTVGFSSHAYFSSCFKALFGIEPSCCCTKIKVIASSNNTNANQSKDTIKKWHENMD